MGELDDQIARIEAERAAGIQPHPQYIADRQRSAALKLEFVEKMRAHKVGKTVLYSGRGLQTPQATYTPKGVALPHGYQDIGDGWVITGASAMAESSNFSWFALDEPGSDPRMLRCDYRERPPTDIDGRQYPCPPLPYAELHMAFETYDTIVGRDPYDLRILAEAVLRLTQQDTQA